MENTLPVNFFVKIFEDHLHIRGEHSLVDVIEVTKLGSPPHTWRTLKFPFSSRSFLRITSTYVENTTPEQVEQYKKEDHLHIRGEHLVPNMTYYPRMGSPPHTWRTLFFLSV